MSYLQFISDEEGKRTKYLYTPEVICKCGNSCSGDSPSIYVDECEQCEGKEMKEYTDKQINSMILFLRVNNIAEMYYLENDQDPDRKFYCYRSDSWLTRKQVISTALDSGWKERK